MSVTPRITELLDYLDREREYFDRAVASVAPERHTQRPSADKWSVAEVVNHMGITDTRITALLTKLTREARDAGATSDTDASPILPTIDVRRVLDRTTKIRNPRGDPPAACSTAEGLAALDSARVSLRSLLTQPDLPALSGVSAPHPAFGPLTGYEWVAFMAAHTHRHADQIREIGKSLSS